MASHFSREIAEQPSVLRHLLAEARPAAEAVAREVERRRPRFVFVAARGSSDNAGRYAQYLFGIRHGLPVALAAPSIVTAYGARLALEGALVLGISQSGQSPDIVRTLEAARREGAFTVALTNDPRSPLAGAAEASIPLCAGEERSVAASKTYSAQLGALALLSSALRGDAHELLTLRQLPDVLDALLERALAPSAVELFRDVSRLAVIGRGYNFATAFEVALKLEETCYLTAEPRSPADFRHGPVAMVGPGFLTLLVAPSGETFADVAALARLCADRGGDTLALSDVPVDGATTRLALPGGVPEWVSPLVAVVQGQRLALALAEARGIDPDAPRGLSKVTRTL